jgi:hypothetical protein
MQMDMLPRLDISRGDPDHLAELVHFLARLDGFERYLVPTPNQIPGDQSIVAGRFPLADLLARDPDIVGRIEDDDGS